MSGRPAMPIEDRFFEKVVEQADGCWLWTAQLHNQGHGRFRLPDRHVYAHRWAYEFLVGPVPEGMELDHLCRVRACVNPAHLEPVTHRENVLRGVSPAALHAAKTHCPKGHAFDEANTYVTAARSRQCRECRRASNREWKRTGRMKDLAIQAQQRRELERAAFEESA